MSYIIRDNDDVVNVTDMLNSVIVGNDKEQSLYARILRDYALPMTEFIIQEDIEDTMSLYRVLCSSLMGVFANAMVNRVYDPTNEELIDLFLEGFKSALKELFSQLQENRYSNENI